MSALPWRILKVCLGPQLLGLVLSDEQFPVPQRWTSVASCRHMVYQWETWMLVSIPLQINWGTFGQSPSLVLSFLIYKVGIIILVLQGVGKEK